MKRTGCFLVLFLIPVMGFSQSLEGDWKGYYTTNNVQNQYQTDFSIRFTKINDTTFEGTSRTIIKYSKKESDTAICILRGGFHEKNILFLEETRALKDFANTDGCLQLMKLYYNKRKNNTELTGNWYAEDRACGTGQIRLIKTL